MRIHVVTGGVRAGKSGYAQARARGLGGDHVTFIATARPTDGEMARRIARHRAERPPSWTTVEAPYGASGAVRRAATDVVLLDCLTLLLANALMRAGPGDETAALRAIEAEVSGLIEAAAARAGDLIVVTNEIGWGVHPDTALGRWFRDGLGLGTQRLAAAADDVILMVAGIPLALRGSRPVERP